MQHNILTLLPLAAPLALYLYAAYLLILQKQKVSSSFVRGEFPAIFGLLVSVAGLWLVFDNTEIITPLLDWQGLGFSVRLDSLSIIMLTMIALLGFVIIRFSTNYMDGDKRKNVFIARLAITIASVELLVLSGNLFQILVFWVITSICLHYLLVFYRHRPQAIAAARKKFIVARLGDLSLLVAVIMLYLSFDTGDLGAIFAILESGTFSKTYLTSASVLLVSAAFFKSAQFPTHGWLIEVVETPTPVSALLHAGLLNAGPFLMVRFSYLLTESVTASTLLIIVGGFTALLASVIYLTQPSIKVSLGYSSVAHMGFSLMLSGVGLYAAAILHIVAHSFYKAHAFLSSGSVIEQVKGQRIKQTKRRAHPILMLFSIGVSLTVFLISSYVWGLEIKEDFSIMFIGAVIIMGLSQFLVQTIDSKGTVLVLMQSVGIAFVVSFSFLGFEEASRALLYSQIPALPQANIYVQASAMLITLAFALIIVIQMLAPGLKPGQFGYNLGIHLRNGLYANVLFDRVIGSLKYEKFKWANLSVQEESVPEESVTQKESVFPKQSTELVNN